MSTDRLNALPILFNRLGLESLPAQQRERIAAVDAILPQTQCGLCDHPDGCLPYAVAIVVDDEAHNKCVPGGQPVSNDIADILGRESLPVRQSQWPVDAHTGRPTEVRAIIREDDCIGCTKCIPACPVDAIIGTGKHMHTIFTDLCTGCELCLAPCPVDCIDLVELPRDIALETPEYRAKEQAHLRQRYHTHLNRVAQQMTDNTHAKPVTSMVETMIGNASHQSLDIDEDQAKATIAAAKLRTKIKKLEKQLSVRANATKQAELDALKQQLMLIAG
ncbi:RnfABCDGE type electron transport complex subunit B [Psychrobacter sp. YP14]|uniref:RnfABCDGE type electron transport complex subunit B n=3 Tax=Psychrobacter TaxID=497 RepID=A0A844LZG3_9GAMM|nr:RnfABCDGE type electron transport complex subunit B [Psychrobacter sp. YP14]AWT48856.1 RnfABCDGE type electron transport complex subunit B [Psychrobacter sp. YP14]MUG31925.1 RnfABCDGE type electron transport complex subunit B [Psychrobacter sanguinis]